jgi:2-oxoglutarate dehydrogenase E2 component (dihydrolipoamide succinyltransferase)
MSVVEIRVPQLPESVADATLVAWRKQPGEAVGRDENLADLETDKVVLEVPAPLNGVIKELKVQAGATVKSGDLLAILEEGAAPAATASAPAAAAPAASAAASAAAAPVVPPGGKAGPAARRKAEEAAKAGGAAAPAATASSAPPAAPAPAAATSAAPATGSTVIMKAPPIPAPVAARASGERADRRVPMTRLRQRVAERLVAAQSNAALLTTFNEVDLTEVIALRSKYKDGFEKKHGVKLGFMAFFVKAAIEGLKRYPVINAAIDGTDIVYHDYYDIGVAVSTDRGLMVPVLRDADAMSFAGVEQGIGNFAKKARDGTISLDDLSGGTFSITNGGVFGSLLSTPIVNAPQSAILGMHKTQERAMVVNGQVVARPVMYLALSYDHRIIDGREAVQFLVTVKECLEDPGRMLLGV